MQSRRWQIFLLVVGLLFTNYWLLVANSYAQQESVTITTYYPSPYGSYNELSTNKLAVGYTDPNEQPNIIGDIRLKPWISVPSTESGRAGEVAYGSDGYLYAYNGSSWVSQGGGDGFQFVAFGAVVGNACWVNVTKQNSSGQNYMYACPTAGCCCRAPATLVCFYDNLEASPNIYRTLACVK